MLAIEYRMSTIEETDFVRFFLSTFCFSSIDYLLFSVGLTTLPNEQTTLIYNNGNRINVNSNSNQIFR